MENQVQLFNHPEFGGVRVVNQNEPWFIGKDVATALGYKDTDKALRDHVPDKYKLTRQISGLGQRRNMTLINEAGMYKLVMRSKLPSAEKFSDWVCEEVLPSIRKTGLYINPNAPINPDLLIKIANDMKALAAQRDEYKALAAAKDETIKELEPKAAYCEKILQSPEAILVTLIAKDYGMGGAVFNKLLHSYRIQYPLGKTWALYREYTDKGYTVTETVITKNGGTATQMKWTQKGRMFLYEFLKERGIVPLCERQEIMPDLFGGASA